MKKIAFIGLGNMGSPLCQRLLLKYNVDIFDINKTNLKPLETLGGRIVKDLQTIANNDFIFLCLPTSDIVESLIIGDKGLAKHLKKGASIIDMTTGEPKITRKIENILSKIPIFAFLARLQTLSSIVLPLILIRGFPGNLLEDILAGIIIKALTI